MFQVYRNYKQNWVDDKVHMRAYTSFMHLLDMLHKLGLQSRFHELQILLSTAPIYHQYTNKYRNH